jgi:hypothetical protein
LKVASVKPREPENPQEVEPASRTLSRPTTTALLDIWVAANGTSPTLLPQPPPPAPLRRAVTPQPSLPFKSPPISFRHLEDGLNDASTQGTANRGLSLYSITPAKVYQHPSPSSNYISLVEQMPRIQAFPASHPAAPSFAHAPVPLIIEDQYETTVPTSIATDAAPAVSSQPNTIPGAQSSAKPPNFEPFIAAIKRARCNDDKQVPRTEIGARLSKLDYEMIGLSGLKHVAKAALAAGVIVTGGSENDAWIGLPEWFNLRDPTPSQPTGPAAPNRPPVRTLELAISFSF